MNYEQKAEIEFRQLSLTIGNQHILNQFNANILKGEIIGVLGPNGSGKSTLLKAILGLVKPSSGELLLFGEPSKKGNKTIGYMPQMREQLHTSQLNARTRIAASLEGYHFGLPLLNKEKKDKINEMLKLVDALHYADKPFLYLSGGEQQRIALAQALLNQPKILLLDEPLSNLDPGQQEKMMALIENIQKQFQITVFITAHDVNPLLNAMNRVIYLNSGKAAIGNVKEIINSEKLSWLYHSPIEVIHHNNRIFVIHQTTGGNLHDYHHLH